MTQKSPSGSTRERTGMLQRMTPEELCEKLKITPMELKGLRVLEKGHKENGITMTDGEIYDAIRSMGPIGILADYGMEADEEE